MPRAPEMCLILFACRCHPGFPLVIAANRDEDYSRPTLAAGVWADAPRLLAGRDARSGGTWLGVTTDGRFAAVTNYREPGVQWAAAEPPVSRGTLVADFLRGSEPPLDYARRVAAEGARYRGFNLLLGNVHEVVYCSNRGAPDPRPVAPGVHGLSNHLLDTPWPKVVQGRAQLAACLERAPPYESALLNLLESRAPAADRDLPDTGVGLELERGLSPLLVDTGGYGTRSSSVLLFGADSGIVFVEREQTPGAPRATLRFELRGVGPRRAFARAGDGASAAVPTRLARALQ